MELAKIEKMLESYFEGTTTLDQEKELGLFFKSDSVPAHLDMYRPLFMGFDKARQETTSQTITIGKSGRNKRFWSLSIAASLLIAVGVVGYSLTQDGLTSEEREALAAFEKTKETMFLFSKSFNEGTEKIAHLQEFSKGVSNMAMIG
ncbi:MAG: hypothetical protein AAF466_12875 [Bacteroidota bacterium]